MKPPPQADEGWLIEAARVADGIRRRALEIAVRDNGGYLTQACCAAEMLATLYVRLMRLGPSTEDARSLQFTGVPRIGARSSWGGVFNGKPAPQLDRFVLSPAHYALPLYATLCEVGRLPDNALDSFGRDGSALEMIGAEHSPGMEVTSGSLGQALSVAIGQAIARRRRGDTGRTWVFLSDGELQEGQTWEAVQVAAHHRLDNVTVLLDANGFQVDGPTDDTVRLDPLPEKLAAFGWDAIEVDGHDVRAIADAGSRPSTGQPRFIICRTQPWRGIPSLRARYPAKLHFIRFRPGEADAALAGIGAREKVPA